MARTLRAILPPAAALCIAVVGLPLLTPASADASGAPSSAPPASAPALDVSQSSRIRGKVLNAQGSPVGACVTVYVGSTDEDAAGACTDAFGEYAVEGLRPGSYQVLFDPRSGDYASQWYPGQARRSAASTVTLGAGGQATVNATLRRSGVVTGVVTEDGTGRPVRGVRVRAHTHGSSYTTSALTDGAGRYILTGLDDQEYRLRAVPGSSRLDLLSEWYADKPDFDKATPVTVPAGTTVVRNFALDEGATVSGTVTDDKDRPVAGIGVDVFDASGTKALTAWTDWQGRYTSTALRDGTYKVRFMPGYYGGDGLVEQWWNAKDTEAQANTLTLGAQEQRTGVNAKLRKVGQTTAPGAPTAVKATAGDGQVTVTWSAPANDGRLPVTRYLVEGAPRGECETLGDLSCTIKGLDNGVAHTFTVVASNSTGRSAKSEPSAPTTPFGTPQPPTGVTAVAGRQSATVSWTPGGANGSPITGYTVTSTPGGKTCTTTATSCTVTGLAGGTAHTFTVRATNVAGQSEASSPSAPVTPSGSAADGTRVAAPAKLKVKVRKGRLTAKWAAVPGARSYQVKVTPAKSRKSRRSGWKRTSKTSFTSRKLAKGAYIVTVRAVGATRSGPAKAKRFTVK